MKRLAVLQQDKGRDSGNVVGLEQLWIDVYGNSQVFQLLSRFDKAVPVQPPHHQDGTEQGLRITHRFFAQAFQAALRHRE